MPKSLDSRSKELVANLIRYFEQERDNEGPLLPLAAVRERVAAALCLSKTTVSAISTAVKTNEVLTSPKKKRSRSKSITNPDLLDSSGIRNTIYELYEKRQQVTLSSVQEELRRKELFHGCRSSLHKLLRELGFKWQKDNPRRGLMELPSIVMKRVDFLRSYMKTQNEKLYQFVYIDETWIFQNGVVSRSWQDENKRSVKSTKVDGKRFIILHAGNEDGFIEGADAIFASKTQLGDYHGEMNQENFLLWFENQLLKHLSSPSMIVMDNAPYHSMLLTKIPNSSWSKADIQDWLRKQKLDFSSQMFKAELLDIVKRNKPVKRYIVDNMAEQYGHKVLRLPPYHCIFNPIEHIWGITKNYYNRHVGRDGNSQEKSLKMWSEAIATITPEIWKNTIVHTEKEICKWYERERILDQADIAPIIITDLEDNSSDSDFEFGDEN